ncbi:UNVERIFIED_CONTAM: hypothetical protein FKN15_015178 [Acipenser sinensis]
MSFLTEEQEFDFDFLFEYNQGEDSTSNKEAFNYATPNVSISLPLNMGNPCLSTYHGIHSSQVMSSNHQAGYMDNGASGYYLSPNIRPNGAPTLESPRIEITPYIGMHHGNSQYPQEEGIEESMPSAKRPNSIVTLTLPTADNYRDPSCLSPASSLSPRSCNSEASSYESGYSYNYDNSPQNSPWQSPCVSPKGTAPEEVYHRRLAACTLLTSPRHSPSTSPRTSVTDENWLGIRNSRPTSPCGGKRKYSFNGVPYRHPSNSPHNSPTPSPQTSPRLSVTDETWLNNTNQYTNSAIVAAINALTTDNMDMNDGIPVKSRKTNVDHMSLKVEPDEEEHGTVALSSEDFSNRQMPFKKENYCGEFLSVPQNPYSWSKPKSYISPSLPALDWQLPSCSGPYELQVDVQPKSHHRAHYETEGSRGAVKASAGGHPIVQASVLVFHAWYLRFGAFGVSASALGAVLRRFVQRFCAWCLVLRHLGFGAHAQRSAQELPLVENQSMDSFPVTGGKKMVLSGHNFLPDSKVVFVEKAPDDHHIWEMDAKVDKDSIKSTSLVVEIPLYRNQRITSPIQVNFYVCNGKRKRSQCQRFTYLPANVPIIKTEPTDDYEAVAPGLSTLSKSYYNQQVLTSMMPPDPGSCMVASFPSYQQRNIVMSSSSSTSNSSPRLHDLSPSAYTKCNANTGHSQLASLQQPTAGVPTIQEVPNRSVVVHPNSPDQSSLIMLQSQVSQHLSSNCPHGYQQTLYPNSPTSPVPSAAQETLYVQTYSPPPPSLPMGQQPPQLKKTQQNGSPTNQPGSLPLLPEENSQTSLPVVVKQEPQELDQMYLDDGKWNTT